MDVDKCAPLQQKFLCLNFHDGDDSAICDIVAVFSGFQDENHDHETCVVICMNDKDCCMFNNDKLHQQKNKTVYFQCAALI